jgi:Putative zinc-finger
MTHPGPLLTDYVDGTLAGPDRAAVEAHLASCSSCRAEVTLAGSARSSLRSLPAVTPPPGLTDAALAEAASPAAPTGITDTRATQPAWRWIGAAAAAAAVLLLLVVASPKLGGSPSQTLAGAGAADVSFAKADAVDVVRANLSQEQLASVAASLGGVQPAESAPTVDATGAAGAFAPDLHATSRLPDRLPEASACLDRAWQATPGQLTRVLLARYLGAPAYFGLFAVGPGAGLPPTRLQLLVASVEGCQPLASAYALL